MGWRAPTKVLLLQEPLVDILVNHALGSLRQWGPATSSTLLLLPLSWSTLSRLEWRSPWSSTTSTRPSILSLMPAYRILLLLLLLLHLHLMLKPLLERCSYL